jgi:hypothetical protein
MMTALCLGMVIAMDRRVARAEAQTDDVGAHDASSPAPSPLEVAASGGMPEPAEP